MGKNGKRRDPSSVGSSKQAEGKVQAGHGVESSGSSSNLNLDAGVCSSLCKQAAADPCGGSELRVKQLSHSSLLEQNCTPAVCSIAPMEKQFQQSNSAERIGLVSAPGRVACVPGSVDALIQSVSGMVRSG